VTLTSDNGGLLNDVFDGTIWNDSADPNGLVPYAVNDGLTSDHAYVNGLAATTLAPEEGLGAFIGEDPNGTWTLRVSDDTVGDTGTLDAWSLSLTALPQAIPTSLTSFTNSTPVVITPDDPVVVSSTLTVSGMPTFLVDLDVYTMLPHTYSDDLDVTLTSPLGTIVTLTTDNAPGSLNAFAGTFWNDDANPGGQVPYAANGGLVTIAHANPTGSQSGCLSLSEQVTWVAERHA
jgi:subtilisin-like proprotein convertase family protein